MSNHREWCDNCNLPKCVDKDGIHRCHAKQSPCPTGMLSHKELTAWRRKFSTFFYDIKSDRVVTTGEDGEII